MTRDTLRALDALTGLCASSSPILLAYIEAQGTAAHAERIWRHENPDGEPQVSEIARAVFAVTFGRPFPPKGSQLYQRARDRREAAFRRFYATPAATVEELTLKLACMVLQVDAAPLASAEDASAADRVLDQLRADALAVAMPPGAG